MAVETATQCDWLNLLTSGTLIPASAFVAISLFIIREILDCCRKAKAKNNEILALKRIFARECQLAWYINSRIKEICEQFQPFESGNSRDCPYEFSVSKTAAGKSRYLVSENGSPRKAGILNEPQLTPFSKHLYDASKLDETFYEKINSGYQAVIELKHFYESLVDNDDMAELTGTGTILFGFAGYALEEMEWIEHNLRDLYKYCTEKELSEGLLR